jgi:tRNA(Arg) A34 adenosine deaminase TadA
MIMKKTLLLICLTILITTIHAQQNRTVSDDVDLNYFTTHNRAELIQKLVDLPCGILADDQTKIIIQKLEKYLLAFQPGQGYSDDVYAKQCNLQALISVKEGGYGIGAVLIDKYGKIIAASHNKQIQKHRSDYHGEMALLSEFESSSASRKYLNSFVFLPGITVFSTAEPCPMCFIRLNEAGVDTKYCTPGPEDGMINHIDCLPVSWRNMAAKHSVLKGNCSPIMQKFSHILFYSYLLDNRGPKQ